MYYTNAGWLAHNENTPSPKEQNSAYDDKKDASSFQCSMATLPLLRPLPGQSVLFWEGSDSQDLLAID